MHALFPKRTPGDSHKSPEAYEQLNTFSCLFSVCGITHLSLDLIQRPLLHNCAMFGSCRTSRKGKKCKRNYRYRQDGTTLLTAFYTTLVSRMYEPLLDPEPPAGSFFKAYKPYRLYTFPLLVIKTPVILPSIDDVTIETPVVCHIADTFHTLRADLKGIFALDDFPYISVEWNVGRFDKGRLVLPEENAPVVLRTLADGRGSNRLRLWVGGKVV